MRDDDISVVCRQCGIGLPSIFAQHPYCAWCVKAQGQRKRWDTYPQPIFGHKKTQRSVMDHG